MFKLQRRILESTMQRDRNHPVRSEVSASDIRPSLRSFPR